MGAQWPLAKRESPQCGNSPDVRRDKVSISLGSPASSLHSRWADRSKELDSMEGVGFMDQLSRIGNDRILVKATSNRPWGASEQNTTGEETNGFIPVCNFLGSKQFRCFVDLQNLQAQLALSSCILPTWDLQEFSVHKGSFHKGSLHTKDLFTQRPVSTKGLKPWEQQ